jgi:hypothetical protein
VRKREAWNILKGFHGVFGHSTINFVDFHPFKFIVQISSSYSLFHKHLILLSIMKLN